MKMRLIMLVVFLTAMTACVFGAVAAVERARTDFNLPPQPFQSYDDRFSSGVKAAGTKDKLLPIQASAIEKALQEGRHIRMQYVDIQGDLRFSDFFGRGGVIKQFVYFKDTTFSGHVNFNGATFLGGADFRGATFSRGTLFMGTTFSKGADFKGATFSALGPSLFERSDIFAGTEFSSWADFTETMFSGRGANFMGTTFSRRVDFREAQFPGWVHFKGATFKKEVFFTFKSLEGHIRYDEVFFRNLIKHYQDTGWPELADDAYYLYRRERRRQTLGALVKKAELIFLEIPFGYGVRPWILLRSFAILWGVFSYYYIGFLNRDLPTDWRMEGFSALRYWTPSYHHWLGFGRCLLYSLDILTPAIDLESLESLKRENQLDESSSGVIWGRRIQKACGWYLLALFLVMFGKIWVR